MYSYGDNDADATLASDDELVKLHAHKGINSDTLACALEHSVFIDVTLASMDKHAERQAHKVISQLTVLRNIT